ncbi:MAG: hypothetical protein VST69_03825, partial [Nitrospirota bacterium]|nr:hypothetical protein [Nitrospirota bacterium]
YFLVDKFTIYEYCSSNLISRVLSSHERSSERSMTNFLNVRLWNLAKDRCGDSSCILQCITGR